MSSRHGIKGWLISAWEPFRRDSGKTFLEREDRKITWEQSCCKKGFKFLIGKKKGGYLSLPKSNGGLASAISLEKRERWREDQGRRSKTCCSSCSVGRWSAKAGGNFTPIKSLPEETNGARISSRGVGSISSKVAEVIKEKQSNRKSANACRPRIAPRSV